MEKTIVIFTALLPVLLLLFYIYKRDKYQPEPVGQILKAFFYGVLTPLISMLIVLLLFPIMELSLSSLPIVNQVRRAFFEAAIPEETAKFVLLWLFLRKNRYFDENMDGIVYAVCVSLGFAAVENIMYLFGSYDSWLSVGVSRALFAVPGHFGFGVLMGYYYSLVKFSSLSPVKNRILVLLAPILAHGVYDSIVFVTGDVHLLFALVLILCFLIFFYRLHTLCRGRINHLLKLDEHTNTNLESCEEKIESDLTK